MTRLDNILNNPVTVDDLKLPTAQSKLFENPHAPVNSDGLKNFEWMRTVTKEEAQESP